MTVFEEACILSCEQWVDSFESDIPKHNFSKQHNQKMKELFNSKQNSEKYKISKKAGKVLLIAAILLSLTITAFAIPAGREFIVEKFSNHSEYNVRDIGDVKKVQSLKLNYIPEGFESSDDLIGKDLYELHYENNEYRFCIQKTLINATVTFDTEEYDCEDIIINGYQGVYYRGTENDKGIIFNDNDYVFVISGNINKDELVNIAQNVE